MNAPCISKQGLQITLPNVSDWSTVQMNLGGNVESNVEGGSDIPPLVRLRILNTKNIAGFSLCLGKK